MHSNFQVVVHSFLKFGILATICRLKLHHVRCIRTKKVTLGPVSEREERTSEPDSFLVVCFSLVVGRKKNPDSFLAARVFARLNGET